MPITRTYSTEDLVKVMNESGGIPNRFFPDSFIEYDQNILLTDGNHNYCLLEYDGPQKACLHCYYSYRGSAALKVSDEFGDEIFSRDIFLLRTLPLLTNLGARWLNKKMGFTSQGIIQTPEGPCEMFTLTKSEWFNRRNN